MEKEEAMRLGKDYDFLHDMIFSPKYTVTVEIFGRIEP